MVLNKEKLEEVTSQRLLKSETSRSTSSEIEEILYTAFPVLDHGFIRVIDYMGDDSAIVQSARVSYGKGTKKINQDRGLIHYLMRHSHTTPFEMCEIKFHVKLPIFVARQWVRHRTASINEYSGRYSIMGKEFYVPNIENLGVQSTSNRQGRGASIGNEDANRILDIIIHDSENCYNHYEEMLNEDEFGNIIDSSKEKLAREIARMNLPMNYYTEWYWKINLHNLLHFLRLRSDNHSQYEIRAYANVMLDILKKWVPITYEAFMEYKVNGINLSSNGVNIIKNMLNGEKVTQESSGMSKREWDEFSNIFFKDIEL